MNVLVTCGCGDTDQFARDAYKLIFPGHPMPPVVSSLYALGKVKDFPTSGTLYEQAKALLTSDAKYAFYFGDGQVYDLLTGERYA